MVSNNLKTLIIELLNSAVSAEIDYNIGIVSIYTMCEVDADEY